MKNRWEILKDLEKNKGELIDAKDELTEKANTILDEVGTLDEQIVETKKFIARDESHLFLGLLRSMAKELRSGRFAEIWKDIEKSMGILKENDPASYDQIMSTSNPYGLEWDGGEEQKAVTLLITNCLAKSPTFKAFMAHAVREKEEYFFESE